MPIAPTAIEEILADLDGAERGLVLGLLAGGSDGGTSTAGVVAEPVGDRCADALKAIAMRPRAERVRLMGALAREALSPLPAGIERIHPDVLRRALEFESADTIRLIAAGATPTLRIAANAVLAARGDADQIESHAPVAKTLWGAWAADAATDDTDGDRTNATAELRRAVLSAIVAVPHLPPDVRPKRLGLRLLALPPDAILDEFTAAGADLLGASLGGSDAATIKRAAAHVGAPWSERILDAARAAVEAATDSDVNPRSRARMLVGTVVPGKNPRDTLDRLGVQALGDRLAREDPDLAVAVSQRLPPDLGRQLLLAAEPRPDPAANGGSSVRASGPKAD
jgi:hypothetical protein